MSAENFHIYFNQTKKKKCLLILIHEFFFAISVILFMPKRITTIFTDQLQPLILPLDKKCCCFSEI